MNRSVAWAVGIALVFLLQALTLQAQDTTLTLKAPAGGEIFYTTRDTTVQIRWTGVDDTVNVRLEYSSDDGRAWQVISDTAAGGSFLWNIKGVQPSASYRVRVLQLRPPGAQDNVIYSGHSSPVADAWWSPSFDRVVSVAAEADIWDAQQSTSSPLVSLAVPRATYYSVRWSKDSTKIVTGSDDNTALVVDVASNTVTQTLTHPNVVSKVELDPTGLWLFTKCDDNRTRVFNLPGTVARATQNAGSTMDDMVVNADVSRVVLCATEARVYGRSVGLPLAFSLHTVGVISGAWSPDGTKVCTVGGDATIRLWNSTTAVQVWVANDAREGVRSVTFSPDGLLVATGMADSTVIVWDATNGQRRLTFGGYGGAVRMVAFSPDGALLAGASDDNFARIHEIATRKTIRNLQHNDDVGIVRWNAAGDRVLTTSRDGTARIWQIREIVLQSDTSGQFSIAPPPPSFARLTTSGDTLAIRDLTTINVRLEAAQFLDLARIDSLTLRFAYDPSILFRTASSVPLEKVIDDIVTDTNGIRRSKQYFEATVPVPLTDADLLNITFQGTLGQDSVTSLEIVRVDQIGTGPGIRIETRSTPILVRGICRLGGGPRLYTTLGTPLDVQAMSVKEGIRIRVNLAETGFAEMAVFDVRGNRVWHGTATPSEEVDRVLERVIPFDVVSGLVIFTVITPTQRASKLLLEGAR
ncbi:MAG: WD40 repeat domain-containing protein [Candidatus Kapabacteria bacterium]|nr:WD40 repeat domain-containing protein [Candidatus Kapabacteria bacterium]